MSKKLEKIQAKHAAIDDYWKRLEAAKDSDDPQHAMALIQAAKKAGRSQKDIASDLNALKLRKC